MNDRSLNANGVSTAITLPRDTAVSDFIALLKPRVMSLVVFTGLAGILVAPGEIHPVVAVIAILCIALATGASGAVNMWYERDLDARMERTKNRPLPAGRMEPETALAFGVLLAGGSVMVMALGVNYVAAAILALAIGFYVFVYTVWLKRKTPQNIVIGGASGALPPVIGWTIATNSLTFEPITLFLIIFYWTPSHFWALSLYKAKDYEKAKIPMLPNTNGVEETKKKIFIYSLFMLPVIILPYYIGFSGKLFLIASLVLTIYYNYICYDLLKFKKNKFEVKKAKKVFSYSIFYLFLIFVLFLIDKLI